MKQIWPNYSYSPTTNVLTLTGLNIDRDQLLLVTAADRGRIMYNFADSSVTASAFTSGANTALTLVATTAGLTTTAALVIYYDDQVASNSVTVSSLPAISGTVTVNSSANFDVRVTQGGDPVDGNNAFPVYGTVTANVPNIQVCTQGNFAQTSAIQTAIGVINTNNNSQVLAVFGSEVVEEEGISAFVQVRNQISGTVTIGSAIPAGTNRIGVVTIGGGTVTIGAGTAQIGSVTAFISGTVPVSGTFFQATQPVSLATVPTHGVTLASTTVTVSSLPAISGTVTASISNFTIFSSDQGGVQPDTGIQLGFSTEDSFGEDYVRVAPSNPLPVKASGTVTANSSNGSLTTRFGSVTTANTAFATSAVTNANRKYLLIQNITTAANVITVGIGFTPTTTQGIQLFAGAGLTFEGSYIPTGAVNLLSSVTASCYTILEA
jgi:hypothetical protein